MTIPFAKIPQGLRVPGFYAEVNASKANTSVNPQRALIIGQITSGGVATPNVPLLSQGPSDAITQGGAGSMLALHGQYAEALPFFEKAARLEPSNPAYAGQLNRVRQDLESGRRYQKSEPGAPPGP